MSNHINRINRSKRYAFTRVGVLAACAAIMVSCASAPSGSRTKAGDQRQNAYMAHIREEGYAPWIDEDGDIAFKREGFTYVVLRAEDDPTVLAVTLPNIMALNNDADRAKAADAISRANAETKVAKAYLTRQNQRVSIAAEMYLENPDHFAALFKRMLGAIDTAREKLNSYW
jgi:hypothetical protein